MGGNPLCAVLLAALLLAGCGGAEGGAPDPSAAPDDLAAWGLFADARRQRPAADVIFYDVIAPLYSDYTAKRRFFRLPPGGSIGWRERGPWHFPQGTVVVKTFSMPRDLRDPDAGERLLETRLLVRDDAGWVPHVYVWNEAQTAARRTVAGARLPVEWIHHDGAARTSVWRVPNTNQCSECHGRERAELLGLHTAQLARPHDYGAGPVDPIDHFAGLGLFEAPPAGTRPAFPDPFGDGPLEGRARAYLDANCAHCHRADGPAGETGLRLGAGIEDPKELGICRPPFSAGAGTGGLLFDVVPGQPEASILVHRMRSTEPDVRMPELGSAVPHEEGIALVAAWIAAMEPAGCP